MRPSRILLIVILATAAFYIAGFIALGSAVPTAESSGREIVDWFASHRLNARIYAWTSAFVSFGLVLFAGQVAALLPRPNRYIFLAGVLGFAFTAQIQAWFWAGLALHPADLEPGVARTVLSITTFWGPLVNASTAAMAAAFASPGFGRPEQVPAWLTLLSVVFLVEQLIETITVFGESGFTAPGGAMNVYLGGVLGFLWVAGVVKWAIARIDLAGDVHAASAR
jgi:hypothetical protein